MKSQVKEVKDLLSKKQQRIFVIGNNIAVDAREVAKQVQLIDNLRESRKEIIKFSAEATLRPDHEIAVKIEDGDLPTEQAILRFNNYEAKEGLQHILNTLIDHRSTEIDEQIDRLEAMISSIHSLTK
jgi:hypothetical protein